MLRRKPRYSQFGLPPPPSHLPKVWYICDQGNSEEPILLNLLEGSQVWVVGWLVPALPNSGLPAGIELYFNGQKISPCAEGLLPENAFELSGAVSCISPNIGPAPEAVAEAVKLVEPKISARIQDMFHRWLTEEVDSHVYKEIIQPLVSSSSRLRGLIVQNSDYQQLFEQHHRFDTNIGPKTLSELLAANQSESYRINATLGLHPNNLVLQCNFDQGLLVDLRQSNIRSIATKIIHANDGEIEFVDVVVLRSLEVDIEVEEEKRNKLRKLFLDSFQASKRHRCVKVDIQSPGRLAYLPAALFPSDSDYSRSTDIEGLYSDTDWVWTSTLWLNPQSDLAKGILDLPPDNEAVKHVPIVVHNLAVLFACGNFPREFQVDHWNQVTELVEHIRKLAKGIRDTEKKRAILLDQFVESIHTQAEVEELKKRVSHLECELRDKIEELEHLKITYGIGRESRRV